jgi:5'-deoxynucleotidase YfbR-like HD superfamily hydrolase
MPKIFLSYSRKDKEAVLRLERDIRAAGIDVWIDDSEIVVGDPVSEKIEEGLKESDYVGIWLTRNSIDSGWVRIEWLAKLHAAIKNQQGVILPLLAEDKVDVPLLLRDREYADFRTDYETGLKQLLKALRSSLLGEERTIAAYVRDFLEDLTKAFIPLPLHGTIHIIATLKKMPRSGKKIRLDTYSPSLPVRSVYDHILSLSHSADHLFPIVQHGIRQQEKVDLARCIAYHDLPEVLLGDIPGYTNLTDAKRARARVFAERRLSELPSGEPERITSEFIGMFLDGRERNGLNAANQTLSDKASPVGRFFCVLDKIDPIIAVWRYLHYFRGKLDPNAMEFLKRMRDFFDNPRVKEIAKDYKEDRLIQDLALTLQDRQLARRYYSDQGAIPARQVGIGREALKGLIEGTNFVFAEGDKRSSAKSARNIVHGS